MKWEMRKGWDVLLKAYWKAFGPSSPLHNNVSLYLKVKWIQLYSGGAGNHNINELIGNWSKKKPARIHVHGGHAAHRLFKRVGVCGRAVVAAIVLLRRCFCVSHTRGGVGTASDGGDGDGHPCDHHQLGRH
ncbi:putative mannosyltransferase-like protein, partial [Trypanosoma cruzi]